MKLQICESHVLAKKYKHASENSQPFQSQFYKILLQRISKPALISNPEYFYCRVKK